ncbi:hypothetical protein M569_08405 [Genlisea aurea]|uniref:Uncharacterized protein n=1 Tax=Genlisea aurea TaxID=192259 RepID=S8DTA0_9LAMI|nr:hypothetical protein M569_08405 [Genlisea aurea]
MAGVEAKLLCSDLRFGKMVFQPILDKGVFRFDSSADDRDKAFPSISFQIPTLRDKPLSSVHEIPKYIPSFGHASGQQIVKMQFPPNCTFYGTGEVSGQLERTGKRVFTWNTDAWGYGSGTTSLYQSHPWVLVVFPSGEALGVLADTTRRCEIDLRQESVVKFVSSTMYPVVTFGPFPSPVDVLVSFSKAVGTVFMPPKWSLGYHQCRWSYASDMRVLEVSRTFREKGIPCDVIWMDIDYMDGFRCFTFDKACDPKSMVDALHQRGFKSIWMLDPGIKHEKGYFVYDSGSENDIWIQTADGKPFIGDVWPGPCVFPDFTQSAARSWWARLVKDFISNGVDGIWNDMNEPAVFKSVTKTMPESNIHRGDTELGGTQNHAYYHNVYGVLMARSTYEGMKLAKEQKRPFVLTRAAFVGSQKYAATWTGDNLSTWEHLHMSLSMVLQLQLKLKGLSGQPLAGPDIGGFAGNATPKLFGRWMGIGAMFPFCRGHSETDTADHEPWSFGEECEEVCRRALRRRYRLLPHMYTLFYIAHTTGVPVATPTFFADLELRAHENSFLLGSLLVYASTKQDQELYQMQHRLPKGIWHGFDFEDTHPDLPALYLRGGSIIPVGPPIQHVDEASSEDDLLLLVALDEQGKAEGFLFEDDGDGYEFTSGGYLLTTYAAERQSCVVTVKVLKTEGLRQRPNRLLHVQLLLGKTAKIDAWGTDGKDVQIVLPSEIELTDILRTAERSFQRRLETAPRIPELDAVSLEHKWSVELSKTPIQIKAGEWEAKVVPWIGTQWLHSRIDIDGYEEYSGTEYRSAGCHEQYSVIRRDTESVMLEGDIGGGLSFQRQICIPRESRHIIKIDSAIIARNVGAGSGGFLRVVCLRVHPVFTLLHPSESYVWFTAVDGSRREVWPPESSGEQGLGFEGDERPNGEWVLVDGCVGLGLVNRFEVKEVEKCVVHWGTGTVNLELWSEARPVSKDSPLRLSHHYQVGSSSSPLYTEKLN